MDTSTIGERFGDWQASLKPGLSWTARGPELVIVDAQGRILVVMAPTDKTVLELMDQGMSVKSMLVEHGLITGEMRPARVFDTLGRMARAGVLDSPRDIPGPGPRENLLGRLVRPLLALTDMKLSSRVPLPGRRSQGLAFVLATLMPAASLLLLTLVLILGPGLFTRFYCTPLAAALGFMFSVIGSLSIRGLMRLLYLSSTGRTLVRIGLRVRMGLPFFDLDPRMITLLPERGQVEIARVSLASLGLTAGILGLIDLAGVMPWTSCGWWGVFLVLVLDACPFARTSGGLLMEHSVHLQWVRGRTYTYLSARLLRSVFSRLRISPEERSFLIMLGIWSAYILLAFPLVVLPALLMLLDLTSSLLIFQGGMDKAATAVGLLMGFYLGTLGVAGLVAGVLALISFTTSSLSSLMPGSLFTLVTDLEVPRAEVKGLLAGMGLAVDKELDQGRFYLIPERGRYPRPGNPLPGMAVLVRGSAEVVRTEISGLVHWAANAGPGWLLGSTPGKTELWRWSLEAREPIMIWELDRSPEPSSQAGTLLTTIRLLEESPATWGLGPDGARLLAQAGIPRQFQPGETSPEPGREFFRVLLSGSLVDEQGRSLTGGVRLIPGTGAYQAGSIGASLLIMNRELMDAALCEKFGGGAWL